VISLGKTRFRSERSRQAIAILILIAAIAAVGVIVHIFTDGRFLNGKNIEVILSNAVYPTFLAWSLCFLFACGYTDMSMGGILVLGSFAVCAMGNIMGYAGVIKRWNFARLKESHGTGPNARHGGSMGACSSPSRVWKGKKMAGHLGAERVTVQNLAVVKIDAEDNLIAIKGAIPGANGGYVVIKDSVKA